MLEKDEAKFGPLDFVDVHYRYSKSTKAWATVRYANPRRHEDVIRYYNQLKLKIDGHILFFEPTQYFARLEPSKINSDDEYLSPRPDNMYV